MQKRRGLWEKRGLQERKHLQERRVSAGEKGSPEDKRSAGVEVSVREEEFAGEKESALQKERKTSCVFQELQDLLLAKMKELNTFQETNVSLRNELDALRSMLEEEEQQMTIRPLLALRTPPFSSHLLPEPFQSPAFDTLPDFTNGPVPELIPSDPGTLSKSGATSDGNNSPEEESPGKISVSVEGQDTG
ncbi:unnamed protein product [Ranitomeya imitator]|uniref:Uncharacterized protein n=1 Tax=Ranitomeya imitator TaxID=111125 RepID=A0ABN9LSB6_9NEOB|nr:unnamed protein product [Ranitomeya imitator]